MSAVTKSGHRKSSNIGLLQHPRLNPEVRRDLPRVRCYPNSRHWATTVRFPPGYFRPTPQDRTFDLARGTSDVETYSNGDGKVTLSAAKT